MKLIDADAIEFHDGVIGFATKCIIDGQPAVDAEPVVHAHWEWLREIQPATENLYRCSRCRRYVYCGKRKEVKKEYPYCHCGAKMDGGDEDDQD